MRVFKRGFTPLVKYVPLSLEGEGDTGGEVTDLKILHFADLHLGVESYGHTDPATGMPSRLLDFLASLDQVVDYALENRVDLVLFCGDAYKSSGSLPSALIGCPPAAYLSSSLLVTMTCPMPSARRPPPKSLIPWLSRMSMSPIAPISTAFQHPVALFKWLPCPG